MGTKGVKRECEVTPVMVPGVTSVVLIYWCLVTRVMGTRGDE
jgi:hypothetical protein